MAETDPGFELRPAASADVGAITAIYRHYVLTHTCSFEIDPPDESTMAARMESVRERALPYRVAERQGRVIGYAYVGPYHARPGYRFTVEDSIYVAPDEVGRGVGRRLLAELVQDSARQGYREMIAIIGDSANAASIGLHRSAGFTDVGILREVGRKFDRWLDVVILQLSLRPR